MSDQPAVLMPSLDSIVRRDRDRLIGELVRANAKIESDAKVIAELRGSIALLGHVIVAVGGSVKIPHRQIEKCQYPLITRADAPDGSIALTARLDAYEQNVEESK